MEKEGKKMEVECLGFGVKDLGVSKSSKSNQTIITTYPTTNPN